MMQSILLPTTSSSLQKKDAVSSSESNIDNLEDIQTENSEKKKNTLFSNLLDAVITSKDKDSENATKLTVQAVSSNDFLGAEIINQDSADLSLINEDESLELEIDDSEAKLAAIEHAYLDPVGDAENEIVGHKADTLSVELPLLDSRSTISTEETVLDVNEEKSPQSEAFRGNLGKENAIDLSDDHKVSEADLSDLRNVNETDLSDARKVNNETSPSLLDEIPSPENSITPTPYSHLSDAGDKPENISLQADLLDDSLVQNTDAISTNEIELAVTEPANNILAQIEAAQKIDTRVSDAKSVSTNSSEEIEMATELNNKSANVAGKSTLKSEETVIKESHADSNKVFTEELLKKQTVATTDKVDQQTVSNQTDRSPLTASFDGLRLHQTIGTEMNKQSGLQQSILTTHTNALHDPLALHSKQNAALLGERVLMMLSQDKQEIQIRLDPAELGSMNIKLQVQQDQVHLTIQTQVGQTRDIIEQHLPKLREQLAQQGVNLGDANIEQQSQQQRQQNQQQNMITQHAEGSNKGGALSLAAETEVWQRGNITLPAQGIDYYA